MNFHRNNLSVKTIKRYPNLLFVSIFIFTTLIMHHHSWKRLPTSKHSWAQSDHYSLALGFLDNNFDFFHPRTYSLTHQFPSKEQLVELHGITAVDFPAMHYTVAGVMYMLDDTSPWVFRLVTLLCSFIALWFAFHMIRELKGINFALFFLGFISLIPVYTYYQNGFHVSTVAFNSLLIGFCFLWKYFVLRKNKFFIWGVFFIMLAALMRFTHIISLISLGGMLFIFSFKNKKFNHKIWLVFIGIVSVLGYFLYNKFLGVHYGSIFLNKPITTNSFGLFFSQIGRMATLYFKVFLPPFHILAFVSFVVICLKNRKSMNEYSRMFFLWVVFSFLGAMSFTFLMTWSLANHDYYSLDVWLPVTLLLLMFLTNNVKNEILQSRKFIKYGNMFLFCSFVFVAVKQELNYRKCLDKPSTNENINNFMNSNVFLDSVIPKESKVLIICEGGWNSPMIGWRRQTSRVATNFSERIPIELNKKSEFIITVNTSFKENIIDNYPSFLNFVTKIDDNNIVTVWKKNKTCD